MPPPPRSPSPSIRTLVADKTAWWRVGIQHQPLGCCRGCKRNRGDWVRPGKWSHPASCLPENDPPAVLQKTPTKGLRMLGLRASKNASTLRVPRAAVEREGGCDVVLYLSHDALHERRQLLPRTITIAQGLKPRDPPWHTFVTVSVPNTALRHQPQSVLVAS